MKPISKAYFLAWILGPQVATGVLVYIGVLVDAMVGGPRGEPAVILVFLLLALSSFVVSVVFAYKLLYRLWTVIQGEDARTTPGKAVGFCFIPFFNFYWWFQAYWGWTVDYNKLIQRRGPAELQAPETIGLWFCILRIGQMIPVVNYCTAIPGGLLYIIFICKAIDSANALLAAQDRPQKIVVNQSDVTE